MLTDEMIDRCLAENPTSSIDFAHAIKREVLAQLPKSREEWVERAQELIDSLCVVCADNGPFSRRHAAKGALLSHISTPPVGYALVPVEPTNEMLFAGSDAADGFGSPLTRTANAYAAMIAAAQKGKK